MQKSYVLDVEYPSYTVIRSPSRDVDQIERETGACDLAHMRESLGDIERGNRWMSRNVRQYAYDVIRNKSFEITHPKSGRKLRLGATYTFTDFQTIFFFFDEQCLIGVVASDLAAGFPLSSIVLFDERLIIHLTDSYWGLGEQHFEALSANGAETIRELPDDAGICLVAGDPNFAHHAWNELSSLQEIAAAGLDENTSLAVFHEPLGPVNAILGSRFNVISKLPRARIPEVNRRGVLTFCSAGTFINRKLVDKIGSYAERNLSPYTAEVRELAMAHGPRSLWISVRTRNRTVRNQIPLLNAIVRTYLQDRSDRMVIVDGHSLPFDHGEDAYWVRDLNDAIARDDGAVADAVIAGVKASLPEANIVRFVGQKIHESIAVARHAGFYFCHHGTVQHKIGWFSPVPGLVHCNREVLQLRPDGWVKQQSEVAALPTYVPVDLLDDEIPNDELGELQSHLHQINYEISDLERASRIVNEFADLVEPESGADVAPSAHPGRRPWR